MHHQPPSIVRLKIPASVKSKGKRPTEEPLAQIQQFFSNNNVYQRNPSHKDEAQRTPQTPNLDFIKLNRMRQATNSNLSNGNSNKLAINKSLNEYEDFDDEATTHYSSRVVCPSHPHKKAKYFLASNTNVRFCTKCAITMAEREPVLDQEKYHKIKEIDKFRENLKALKQNIVEKDSMCNLLNDQLEEDFSHSLDALNKQFEELYQLIKNKHSETTKALETRYTTSFKSVQIYREDIQITLSAMDKYLYDVNRNYDDIVQDLSIGHFDEIMAQYQAKICDYMQRIGQQPSWEFTESWSQRLTDIKDIIRRVTSEERHAGCRSPYIHDRKENLMSHTNQMTKHTKSKTPDRLIR